MMKIFWAVKFNHEETVKSMVAYYKWRQENLPIRPTPAGIDLIKKGFCTIYGRDMRMRPCLILDFGVLNQEIVSKFTSFTL
jgi:hypothetical protein